MLFSSPFGDAFAGEALLFGDAFAGEALLFRGDAFAAEAWLLAGDALLFADPLASAKLQFCRFRIIITIRVWAS